MVRRKNSDRVEPSTITIVVDDEIISKRVYIERAGPNLYQYSFSYDGKWKTGEDLMPSTWHCEEHAKRELLSMVLAKKSKESGS